MILCGKCRDNFGYVAEKILQNILLMSAKRYGCRKYNERHHVIGVNKMVAIGSDAKQEADDQLTYYALESEKNKMQQDKII